MAVDTCSKISSPRISSSHDPREPASRPVQPAIDFDFGLGQSFFPQEISPADELFANGQILPVEIKKLRQVHQSQPTLGHSEARKAAAANQDSVKNPNDNMIKNRLIDFLSIPSDDQEDNKPLPKPFWQFSRSSSLNCNNTRTNGFLRPLQFLKRSNSMGSSPNQQPSEFPKVMQKQHSSKEDSTCKNPWKKPPLGKSHSRLYGKGDGTSPVLNVPPAYIAKGTISLFRFGSFLCSNKSKKKKKKKKE